jgi:cell fate regulator YaaT (PSP1 superfamily)
VTSEPRGASEPRGTSEPRGASEPRGGRQRRDPAGASRADRPDRSEPHRGGTARAERPGVRPNEARSPRLGGAAASGPEASGPGDGEARGAERGERRDPRPPRPVSQRSGESAARSPAPASDDAPWGDDEEPGAGSESKGEWGRDDDTAAAEIALSATLPGEADDDFDPSTAQLDDTTVDGRSVRGDVITVVAVRFTPAGRVTLFDAQHGFYSAGDPVVVDTDRGPRVGWVAVTSERRVSNDRGLRRVLRHASAEDRAREPPGTERASAMLRIAKDRTAALRLPVKVFRAELTGAGGRNDRLMLYITTEERVDLRELVRDLSTATSHRVELRQLGARDEAKAVGGIGSCGLTLCCTTWLPEFVPVSIKMAKDQGLVLNPSKVAGQCGRLKCCLVYEQAGYAELRKGLPKLGKRVVTPRGEGRVVEVDVLRQRVRVSYSPGESEVLAASEVQPMFPSGSAPASGGAGREPDDADDAGDELASLVTSEPLRDPTLPEVDPSSQS